MTWVSYAQNFEDVMLMRAFADVGSGIYIDIGAQDPTIDSVSRVFHERGWRGLHVEPCSHYAAQLRRERPGDTVIEAAITERPGIIEFFEIPGTGISTIDEAIAQGHSDRGHEIVRRQVPAMPLSAVLARFANETVHWLKIDVEGAERAALASWGDANVRPLVVVVESTVPMTQILSHTEWEPLLLVRGYEFVYFDGLNRFYVSSAARALRTSLTTPPNLFDDFELNGTANAPFHRGLLRQNAIREAEHARALALESAARATEVAGVHAAMQADAEAAIAEHRKALDEAETRARVQERAWEQVSQAHAASEAHLGILYKSTADHLAEAQRTLQSREVAWRDESVRLAAALAQSEATGQTMSVELVRAEERAQAAEARLEERSQAAEARAEALKARLSAQTREHGIALQNVTARHAEALRATTIENAERSAQADALWRERLSTLRQDHDRALAQAATHQLRQLAAAQEQLALQRNAAEGLAREQTEAFERRCQRMQAHFDTEVARQANVVRAQTARYDAQVEALDRRLVEAGARSHRLLDESRAELDGQRHAHVQALAGARDEAAQAAARFAAEIRSLREALDASASDAAHALEAATAQRHALAVRLSAIGHSWGWQLGAPLRWVSSRRDPLAAAIEHALAPPTRRLTMRPTLSASTVAPPYLPADNERGSSMTPEPELRTMNSDLDLPATIDDLLSRHDEDFVNHAYRLLLGRVPDPSGFMSYVGLVRAGAAKDRLLLAMVTSEEGRRHAAQVPGLDQLQASGRGQPPGRLARVIGRWMGGAFEPTESGLRAIQNQLYRSEHATQHAQEHLRTIGRALQAMQARLRELELRPPATQQVATVVAAGERHPAGLQPAVPPRDNFSEQLVQMVAEGERAGSAAPGPTDGAQALVAARSNMGAAARVIFGRWTARGTTSHSEL